jgi:hypothetical protein
MTTEINTKAAVNKFAAALKAEHRALEDRKQWLVRNVTINGTPVTIKARAICGTVEFHIDGNHASKAKALALLA